jgi:hypothetical protein
MVVVESDLLPPDPAVEVIPLLADHAYRIHRAVDVLMARV